MNTEYLSMSLTSPNFSNQQHRDLGIVILLMFGGFWVGTQTQLKKKLNFPSISSNYVLWHFYNLNFWFNNLYKLWHNNCISISNYSSSHHWVLGLWLSLFPNLFSIYYFSCINYFRLFSHRRQTIRFPKHYYVWQIIKTTAITKL